MREGRLGPRQPSPRRKKWNMGSGKNSGLKEEKVD